MILGRVSIAVTPCWGFERLLRIAVPMIQGMPSRHDHRTALSPQRTSVRLYPWRFLICYPYRCELGGLRLFFGELDDWRLCSCRGESSRKFREFDH